MDRFERLGLPEQELAEVVRLLAGLEVGEVVGGVREVVRVLHHEAGVVEAVERLRPGRAGELRGNGCFRPGNAGQTGGTAALGHEPSFGVNG